MMTRLFNRALWGALAMALGIAVFLMSSPMIVEARRSELCNGC